MRSKRNLVSRRGLRRRLLLESLEGRRLLVATDLASISGLVFDDFSGNGYDAGEEVAGATLALYRDNGDGSFQQGSDTQVQTTTTGVDGRYTFSRLTSGNYFVLQDAQTVDGSSLQRQVSPLISIDTVAVEGRIVQVIDDFDTTQQEVSDTTNDGVPVTSSVAAPEAIGGERDLYVNKTSENGAVQLSVDDPLLPNLLIFDSIATGNGERRVTWDGPDGDATVVADAGLGNVDLTNSNEALGLQLQIGADLPGGTAVVRLYSDDGNGATANRFSTATLPIPQTGGTVPFLAEFVPFSQFTATSGGGADFSNIGAIELEIAGAANVNGSAELVGTVGETLFTQDFANFASADLRLSKTIDDATPNIGQNVTFTVTLNNDGPDTATNVAVRDRLPQGVSFVSATASQGTYSNSTGIWTVGSVNSGSVATLSLVGRIESAGSRTNFAEVSASDQFDPDSTPDPDDTQPNDESEDDQALVDFVTESIDLSLTKTAVPSTVVVGSEVTFTLTLANAGPSTATGVQVQDQLPNGISFVRSSASQGSYNSQTSIWDVGSVASGASPTLTLVGRVDVPGPKTNTAQVSAADQVDIDSTPGNNNPAEDDQDSVTIEAPQIDLSLTKSASSASVIVGQNVTFTIDLANAGPSTATGVTVRDQLPGGISFVSATPSQGTYNSGTGIWTVGSVAAGVTPRLTLVGRVDVAGDKTNTAEVISADQPDLDSTPNNNNPEEDDQDSVTIAAPQIDLSLTKTAFPATVVVGQNVTFTLNLTNDGPSQATGVVVQDNLPSGISFVSATASQGAYNAQSGLWSVGTVPSGTTPTLTIVGRVDVPGSKTNVAQVSAADQPDIDSTPGNNLPEEDDQDSVTIEAPQIDLSLSKTVDNPTPDVGEEITFTLTVANAGPDNATGVQVRDLIPTGLQFVSSSTIAGSYNQATGIWNIGNVSSGGNVTLTITVTPTGTEMVTNTAEVIDADQPDADSTPDNNVPEEDDQDSVMVGAQQIDVSLTKTVDDSRPNVGDTIEFQLVVSNAGPSSATDLVVEDMLPSGLTFVSANASSGGYNSATGQWTIGTMAATTEATLVILARVDSELMMTNVAEVISAMPTDIDSTPGNNNPQEDDQDSVVITPQIADLSLTKTADNASANVGENITFNVTLQNAGPDSATNVVVRDLLPNGISYVSSAPAQGTYDQTSGLWNVGTVSSGGQLTLQIVGRIETPGDKTNTAEVTAADQFDPDSTPGNNVLAEDDQDAIVITPPVSDLSLDKQIDIERPIVGETIRYTITVSNSGPDAASGVIVADELPNGVTYLASSTDNGSYNPNNGLWTIGAIPANASVTLLIDATVTATVPTSNGAEIFAADQYDPDSTPGNGSTTEDDDDSVTFTPAVADLSLTKTVDNETPNVGQDVTFTIVVANAGPDPATNVSVLDRLPQGLQFVASSPEIGSYDPNTGIWNLGGLAVNDTATLTITATSTTAQLVQNTAQVQTSDQLDPDSAPGNDQPDEDDQASVIVEGQQIDLELSKVVDNARPNVGDEVRFTIRVDNRGPSNATGVVVRDLLPTGLSFQGSDASQGSYNATNGTWNLGSLAADGFATLELSARADEILAVDNIAEVIAADQPDVDSTPNNGIASEDDQDSANVTTLVSDLSLTKTASEDRPNVGEDVTFTLDLRNDGPDAATNIRIQDLLPDGVSFLSAIPSVGDYDPQTGLWAIPELASRTNATLRIVASVDSIGKITNSAELIAVDQADPDSTPNNNLPAEDDQDSATIDPPVIDLSLAKAAQPLRPSVAGELTYTLLLRNDGPDRATGIIVQDQLPAGVTFVSATPSVGQFDPATGNWTVNSLAAESSATLVLRTTVNEPGEPENRAQVLAADQFDSDSTPGNDDGIDGNGNDEDDQASVSVVTASADLSLIKSVDDDRPGVGSNVTFKIQVANSGPDDAKNVVVRDQIPPGMTFVSSNASVGSYNPNDGRWTIPTMVVGKIETLEIVARVDIFGERVNTAEIVASSQFDPDSTPANNNPNEDDQDSVTLIPELVDLALAKLVDDPSPNVGDIVRYTVVLDNSGPSDATLVEVTDHIPAGLTVTGITASQGVYDPASGIWNVGTVLVGENPRLDIDVRVDSPLATLNTAEISAVHQPDVDSTPGNGVVTEDDYGQAAITPRRADLELSKSVNISSPDQNEEVLFTLVVSNKGPNDATNVAVRDILPDGIEFLSSTVTSGSYDPITGVWTIPTVAKGSAQSLQVVAVVNSKAPITNEAEIIASDQFDPDSTPDNQVLTEDDYASVTVTPKLIDISVATSIDKEEPNVGETFQMTFRVTNDGPNVATGVQARITIPAGLTVITARPGRGTYSSGLWNIGTVGVGETVQLTITAQASTRGTKEVPIEVITHKQADIDSDPGNHVLSEDDQTLLLVRVPLYSKRLFLSAGSVSTSTNTNTNTNTSTTTTGLRRLF